MQFLSTDGIDTTASTAATPIVGKISEILGNRRDMLMRFGALAIGVLAFGAVAQVTLADDDDGFYDDDGGYYYDIWGGGYYYDIWGGGYYYDIWGGGYYGDDWGGYGDDDDWGDDD